MERLTKRIHNGKAVMDCDSCGLKTSRKCTLYKCRNQLMKRLAAYEDTGLTPEEIKAPFTEDAMINLAAQALGVEPDRLRELAEADKDGRVVVLPCYDGYAVRFPDGSDFAQHCSTYGGTEGCVEPAIGDAECDYSAVTLNLAKELVKKYKDKLEGRKEADHA